jgi:predicted aspartyl protease
MPPSPQAIMLQGLLDHDDYTAFSDALSGINPTALTEAQRNYFLGMLGFHLGKLDDGSRYLLKAVNASNYQSLTANQVETALEALGQINLKLGFFGTSAQMYADIDKAFGVKMGDGEKTIREERHLSVLLMHVPPQTANITGDFTLKRSTNQYGDEYPVSVMGKPFVAQFDTGAEITVLSASTAKAWGVTMLDGTAKLHGYDGGAFSAQPGFIPSLTIGKAELHNVAVYITADENLYVPQIKHQVHALLGYPVVAALGRLTFAKDGLLTVSVQFVPRDLNKSAALWMADHSLLAALGTQVVMSGDKVTGGAGTRLFVLDSGSGSTYLTDRYLAEHTNVFHGTPPEAAILIGAGGGVATIPAYAADGVPLFAGGTLLVLNGQHILTQPTASAIEPFFGLIGHDVLGSVTSYTVDLRNMTLTIVR